MIKVGCCRYPTTKSVLLKNLGWRLVEMEEEKHVRLRELLKRYAFQSLRKRRKVITKIKR